MMGFGDGIGELKQALNAIVPMRGTQATSRTESAGTADNSSADSGIRADEASLSKTSGLLAQALEGSDVRTAKVEALRQAIASGDYNIASSEVADKIITSLTD
jgi:negative regulator of flagellin synthesis FlgM